VCSHDEKIEVNDFVPPFHGVVAVAVVAAGAAVSNRQSRSGEHEPLREAPKRSVKNPNSHRHSLSLSRSLAIAIALHPTPTPTHQPLLQSDTYACIYVHTLCPQLL